MEFLKNNTFFFKRRLHLFTIHITITSIHKPKIRKFENFHKFITKKARKN